MLRKIVTIDEEKCDGCGVCVPECHEGALQIIDGKARLISDLFCDGLGACLGHCPQEAITIEEREAEPYNERRVMEYIIRGGENTIKAHLEHLIDHNEIKFYEEAVKFLEEQGIEVPVKIEKIKQEHSGGGCPGSRAMTFETEDNSPEERGKRQSHLTQWPIQLHLVSPQANYYQNSNLLLTADCVGFSYPDFHKDLLNGKSIAIACPKLDSNQEIYQQKLTSMINESNLKSITVMIMQVPCCSGLFHLAKEAIDESGKNIPLKIVMIGVKGEVLQEANF